MKTRLMPLPAIAGVCLAASLTLGAQPAPRMLASASPTPAHPQAGDLLAKLPLVFEPNQGQSDPQVRFLARAAGMTSFLTDQENVMVLSRRKACGDAKAPRGQAPQIEHSTVRMKLAGSRPASSFEGIDQEQSTSNYFLGNDPSQWRANVPHYRKVRAHGMYEGIDVVYYGDGRNLEYDFVVRAGADPMRIRLEYEGAEGLSTDGEGNLLIATEAGTVVQRKPVAYQQIDGQRKEVAAGYAIRGQSVEFALAAWDRRQELVIDPVLAYSTYLGGNNTDRGSGIAVDTGGNAYVAGYTASGNFPTTTGAYETTYGGYSDVFVAKLNPAGNQLLYSTYLGGSGDDYGLGIAVDTAGNAYVTGISSGNFPTTPGAYQTMYGGGSWDAFAAKLNPAGNQLLYSTYLGGNGDDQGFGIAVDTAGNAWVTGITSGNFATTPGAYQTTYGGGAYDAFVAKLNPAGDQLVYSTYLGGSGDDDGYGIAVDTAGNAWVTGITSGNFPTTAGAYQTTFGGNQDVFVAKLNPAGSQLLYSTYLGGSGYDYGNGIAVDTAGNAYVTGVTGSGNFPTTTAAYQTTYGGGFYDAFVAKLNPAGDQLLYSTYLGGSGADYGRGIALDTAGTAYITGYTASGNFPSTPGAYQTTYGGGFYDAFVAKLNPPVLTSIQVTPASSLLQTGQTQQFTATAYDQYNNPMIPQPSFSWNVNGGGAISSAGLFTATTTAGGSYMVTASVSGSAANGTAFVTVNALCVVTVSPISPGVPGTTGTLTLTLTNGSCGWTAASNVSWLTPTATSGTSGTLSVAVAANTTGAQRSGMMTVAGQTVNVTQAANNAGPGPGLVSLNPFQGSGPDATLTLVYTHPNGWAALQSAEFIVNPRWESTQRSGGCYVKYAPLTGLFTLIGDDGNSVAGTTIPGSSANISNSQCTLIAANSSATGNGNNLTLVVSLTFSSTFNGQRHIWMQASDYNNRSTNWLVYGVWFPTQTSVTTGPWYRIYDPFSNSYLYSADTNEYNTLGARGFMLQGQSGLVMTGPTTVTGVSNIAWYRVYVNVTNSHFWTSDRNEFLTLINLQQAYVGEGVAAFVMPYIDAQGQVSPQVANTMPFWRAAFQGANLHFWTSDADEYTGANGKQLPLGYKGEGIACYIFPNSGAQGIGTNAQFNDGTAAPLVEDGEPAVVSAVNGASYVANGVVAPGQTLTLYGRHLSGRVLMNGVPARVIAAQDNEIRVVVPQELAGATAVSVEVEHRGRRSKPMKLEVAAANPAIFGSNQWGRGNGQAQNEDGKINDAEHGAPRGTVVTLYTTGVSLDLPMEVHIGGQPAEVVSAQVSGTRAGVMEVRVRIPETVEPAPFQPVVLHVGNLFSQPGVGLAIR